MMILASVSFGAYSILGLLAKTEIIISSTLNCCPPPFMPRDFLPTPSAIIFGTIVHIDDGKKLPMYVHNLSKILPIPKTDENGAGTGSVSLSTNLWSQTSIWDVEMICCRTAFQSVVEFVFSSDTSPEPSCLKQAKVK